MRKVVMAIVSMVTAGVFTAPAATAAARWTCEGPEFVCGTGAKAAAPSYDASERKSARRERAASVPSRPRRSETAAATSNDDKPARRGRTRSRSGEGDNDSGGGATYSGKASYYWEPQALASGGRFNPNALTAAHKTLPFGTRVRVTNQRNGQSVDVVINDRGPYVGGRIIDLSKAAAGAINMQNAGVAPVTVRVLGRG